MKQFVAFFFMFSGFGNSIAQSGQVPPLPDSGKILSVEKEHPLVKTKPAANIFPNPAKNKAEISVTGFDAGFISLQITDLKGNLVRDDKRLLLTGTENIVLMFSLPPGIYFVLLKQKNRFLKKRLLVQ